MFKIFFFLFPFSLFSQWNAQRYGPEKIRTNWHNTPSASLDRSKIYYRIIIPSDLTDFQIQDGNRTKYCYKAPDGSIIFEKRVLPDYLSVAIKKYPRAYAERIRQRKFR
jgi:hypothetical protein